MPIDPNPQLLPGDLDSWPQAGSTGTANAPPVGWTPLHLAATAGDALRVRALLAEGARTDGRAVPADGCVGATALHCAAAYGATETVAALLAAGACPDARDEAGYTPLLLAAERGDLSIVKLLLRAGADPRAELGDTSPLTAARRWGHQRVVGLLKQVCGIR